MKYCYVKYVIALYVLVISAGLTSSYSETARKESIRKPLYTAGGNFLYNRRSGMYIFESFNKQQYIAPPKISLFGFNLGKRYYATPWLRFQIDILLNFGSNIEDTLYYGTYFAQKYKYKNFDFLLDIQLVRPMSNTLDLFTLLGGGINYLHLEEHAVSVEDYKQEIAVAGYKGLDQKQWSPCVHFGAGLDITPSRSFGINFTYAYRIWRPVKFLDARDLPLSTVEYKELFFSHVFQVKFLFNLTGM